MNCRRPSLHFTPQRNWLNDPNGLVFFQGRYHLFFQYNPEGADWGNMSWGHASSTDLSTWVQHPVALTYTQDEMVFSGSVVVDHDNTSGLGHGGAPALVALYTSARTSGVQAQSLAYSVDGGFTWARHPANPVLDRGSTAFRDPKVFRFIPEDGTEPYWVMVAVEAEECRVLFYRSDDLSSWRELSGFAVPTAVGQLWECPDLFPLELDGVRHWVLLLSVNPDWSGQGSATRYFTGVFDGVRFTADSDAPPLFDAGTDCYAFTTFDSAPGKRRIGLGWMSNWAYARDVPTGPWRGQMTLPRELGLARTNEGLRLTQVEMPTVDARVEDRLHVVSDIGTATFPVAGATVIRLEVKDTERVSLEFVSSDTVVGRIDIYGSSPRVEIRRLFPLNLATTYAAPVVARLPMQSGRLGLHAILDEQSIELFSDDGLVALTAQVFPPTPWSKVRVTTDRSTAGASLYLSRRPSRAAVLVIGESLVDVISYGGAESEAVAGGSPFNVAVGLNRLGVEAALHTRIGSDRHGEILSKCASQENVRLTSGSRRSGRSSMATAIVGDDGSAEYEFDAEWNPTPVGEHDEPILHVHTGSLASALRPGNERVLADISRLRRSATVSYDPNVRAATMANRDAATECVERFIAQSDIVKASDEDIASLYLNTTLNEVLTKWLALGPSLVIATCGPRGSVAKTQDLCLKIPAISTVVVDTVGAGDSYMAGVIAALASKGLLGRLNDRFLARMDEPTLLEVMEFAHRCTAITVSRPGADPPTWQRLHEHACNQQSRRQNSTGR